MTNWDFVRQAAPVIFSGSGIYSDRLPLQTEVTDAILYAISVAEEMDEHITRMQEREMEAYTGLKTPRHQ